MMGDAVIIAVLITSLCVLAAIARLSYKTVKEENESLWKLVEDMRHLQEKRSDHLDERLTEVERRLDVGEGPGRPYIWGDDVR